MPGAATSDINGRFYPYLVFSPASDMKKKLTASAPVVREKKLAGKLDLNLQDCAQYRVGGWRRRRDRLCDEAGRRAQAGCSPSRAAGGGAQLLLQFAAGSGRQSAAGGRCRGGRR